MKQQALSLSHLLCLFSVAALFGCTGGAETPDLGEPVDISGKVTLDGEPVGNTELEFYRSGGGATPETRRFVKTTGDDGTDTIDDIYPATYTVSVMGSEAQIDDSGALAAADPTASDDPLAKYRMDSPLSVEVTSSSTTHDLELTSDPQ